MSMSTINTAAVASWRENLRNVQRWRQALQRMFFWMAGAFVVFVALGRVIPGELIFVVTDSIPRGVYWQDPRPFEVQRHQYVTFNFTPPQPWIAERYAREADSRRHTKTIGAVAGDLIVADAEQNYFACVKLDPRDVTAPIPSASAVTRAGMQCSSIGRPSAFDSANRPMTGWLAADAEYELKAGEVWIYGPNIRSLDSRYYGPLPMTNIQAHATPIYQIK